MATIQYHNSYGRAGMILVLLFLLWVALPAQAAPGHDPGDRRPAPSVQRQAKPPQKVQVRPVPRTFKDSRYRHDRFYPVHGTRIQRLPRDHRVVVHHRVRYYFSGGAWYRPFGSLFEVVIPPVGLAVSFLPPYYSTMWVGGVPYYYANNVYYAHRGSGYVVVAPPTEEPSPVPPPADKPFIYPRLGQSEDQQATDRYECHRWAVSQTGFDPTQPDAATASGEKRADYQRAFAACLDGRGYTVK